MYVDLLREMFESANKAAFMAKKQLKAQEYQHLNRKAVISKKHNLVRGYKK